MDNYPALEDVYDLSTQDLKKIQQQLRGNPNGRQQLLEAIILQIQERKALEYFAEICHVDNPYAKKVAAFNEQFLKLAAEAIEKNHKARSQGQAQYESSQLPLIEQTQSFKPTSKSQPDIKKQIQSENEQDIRKSHLDHRQYTDNDTKSIQSELHSNSDAVSTTTTTSIGGSKSHQNSSRVSGEVKMNLGGKKDGKGKIKQFAKNTLAKTLIQDEIIIKRNNGNSPHNNNINPHKKFHIPGQKHEEKKGQNAPNSQKSIKNKQDVKTKQQQKSSKIIKPNSQDTKSKKQIFAKMKQESKKGTVKLPKINQYKDLVEMVKQEEEKKRQRAARAQNLQRLPVIQNHSSPQIRPQDQPSQTEGLITEEIVVQHSHEVNQQEAEMVQNKIIQQQEIEESLSPEKIQKFTKKASENQVKMKDQIVQKQIQWIDMQKQKLNSEGESQKQNRVLTAVSSKVSDSNKSSKNLPTDLRNIEKSQQVVVDYKKKQSFLKQGQSLSNPQTVSRNQVSSQNYNDHNRQLQANIDYTKKLLEQIDQQEHNYTHVQKNQVEELQNNDRMSTNLEIKPKERNVEQGIHEKQRKCYSEQYWAHIRQQAELKIKRFKQEKQYEQKKEIERFEKVSSSTNSATAEDSSSNSDLNSDENIQDKVIQKLKIEEKAFEQQIAKRSQELTKLKKQAMKKTNKKVAEAQAVQKIAFIRPKPEFDYLTVYPSFNHIFSVMYLKPVNQALNDIPNIMREVKTLFSTHIQHFSNRSNFKPAIFLPFDHNGTFQLTDPKQLIAHAQQTYIDLKTMIERVEIFNQNLHGQFNNANDDRFYRVVKTKEQVYDIITTSFMRRKGWKELPHGCSLRTSWNLFWSWSKPDVDLNKLLVWQKINHFPFNKNLSRKDLLYKNLDMFRKSYKVSMNFLPLTFNLPKQFSQLSAKFHEQQMINRDNNFWIMKPIGKSRGRGIKVVSSLSELNYTDNIVVQKYILNPMLIDGYKFDMRIYVLVTSFHPLQAFVYRQGFARLSTQKYTLDAHSIKNTFVHLTNFAINKNNVSNNTNFAGGSKISLKTLKDKITRMGHSFTNIWSQVHDIIIKSLLGCSVSVPSFPTAFQLFGYDIMIDQQCNCHLIQINASPSLERSYMIDQIVKQNLIDDIVDLVDPPDFDKAQLLDVFNERIQAISNKKKITVDDDLIGLARILRYKPIRKVGQKPTKMGLFETVAPCQASKELEVLIKAKSGANNPMNID